MTDWWGDFDFEPGTHRRWRIGPLTLWVTRHAREWLAAWGRNDDPFDTTIDIAHQGPAPAELPHVRYLANGSRLTVSARVADRPVVARPEIPVIVPGGGKATLYVASPLWVELSAGEPTQRFMAVPTWQPSSTWFGENNLEGALYYATRTRARLERRPLHGPRVTTAVTVNNAEHDPLRIERVALPLPSMSVFRDQQGGLWTEQAIVDYVAGIDAPVRIERQPPAEIGPTTMVSVAREARESNMVMRALSAALREVLP